jgi:GGDEF domain-containing protein
MPDLDEQIARQMAAEAAGPSTPDDVDLNIASQMKDEEDQRLDGQVGEAFKSAFAPGIDKQAGVLGLSRRLQIPTSVIEADYDGYQQSFEAAKRDPREWRNANPILADTIRKYQHVAPMVVKEEGIFSRAIRGLSEWRHDTEIAQARMLKEQGAPVTPEQEKLAAETPTGLIPEARKSLAVLDPSSTGGVVAKTSAAFLNSLKQQRYSMLGFRAFLGKEDYESEKELADLELELAPRSYGDTNPLESAILNAAEIVPSIGMSTVGGLVGGVVGGRIAGPAGAELGSKIGAGATSFPQETGGAYLEYRNTRTDDGTLLSPTVARNYALLYGVVSSGLEGMFEGPELAALGPLGDLARGDRKAFLKAVTSNKELRTLATDVAKRWFKAAGGETIEEVSQEAAQGWLKQAARLAQAGKPQSFDADAFRSSLVDTAEKTFTGSLVIGAGQSSINVGSQVLLAPGRVAANQTRASKADQIVQTLAESLTATASPEAVAEIIGQASEEGGDKATSLMVDPAAITRSFEQSGVEPTQGIVALMGPDGLRRMTEAVASGSYLEVPISEFAENWAKHPIAKDLVGHVTTQSGEGGSRQVAIDAKEEQAQAQKLIQEFVAKEEKGETPAETPGETQHLDAVFDGLVGSGKYSEKQAQHIVDMHRAFLHTMAARNQMSVDDVAGFLPISVNAEGKPAATQAQKVAPKADPDVALLDEVGPTPPSPTSMQREREDTSFDVGALEATAPPLERKEIAPGRAEVNTELFSKAQALVARMKDPENQREARAWIDYVIGKTETRPNIKNEALLRKLYSLGIVKEGESAALSPFSAQQMGFKGEGVRGGKGRRKTQAEPASLRQHRMQSAGTWTGYRDFLQAGIKNHPEASVELTEKFHKLSQAERENKFFVDDAVGLLNERAFKRLDVEGKPLVGHVSVEGVKYLNDNVGHEHADGLLRSVAQALHAEDPLAAKVGGDFAVRVGSKEELDDLVRRVQARMSVKGFDVTGAVGTTLESARSAHDALKKAAEDAGTRARSRQEVAPNKFAPMRPLGLAKLGLEAKDLKFGNEKGAATVPAELRKTLAGMSPRDVFDEIYTEKSTGLLSAEGWAALDPKANRAILDLNGLKAVNREGGDLAGDELLAAFGKLVRQAGGADFDAAHLHGDEYVLQSNDPKKLQRFLVALSRVGQATTLELEGRPGTVVELNGVSFGFGIGGSLAEADGKLNEHKEQLTARGERGPEADKRRIRVRASEGSGTERGGGSSAEAQVNEDRGRGSLAEGQQAQRRGDRRQGFAGDGGDGVRPGPGVDKGPTSLQQTKGEDPRGRVEILKNGAERAYRVVLGKKADLSTYLHEQGHIYLDVMERLSDRTDATQQIKNDIETIRRELGATPGKPLVEQVDVHEKFARSFEQYLRTGEAPSRNLAGAFRSFMLWLKNIYKTARQLNADVSPALSDVFDRLLATDDEIEQAHQKMGGGPMFATHEEMGVSPEEFQAYLEKEAKARSTTETKARLRVLKDQARQTETWWKTEEAALARSAAEEFEARPDVRAERYLKTGVLQFENGTQVFGDGPRKLSREAVRRMGGDAALAGLAEHLSDNGLNPDDVAEHFGYPTGRALIDALLAVPADGQAWAQATAAERMRERHPDVLEQREELRAIVAKGLHGDYTADRLIAEVKALEAKTNPDVVNAAGKAMPVESQRRIYELAAKDIVARKTLRKLDAGTARRAEQMASRKALIASAKGNYAQALVHKRQQVLNFYVARELIQAREERDALESTAADLRKLDARKKLGKASPTYRDGVDGILEAVGLKPPSARETPPASLSDVVSLMESDAQTVGFDTDEVGRILADPKDWKDLTVAQAREVHGALKQIQQAARNRSTAIIDGRRQDRDQIIAQLLTEAIKNEPSKGQIPSSESAATITQRLTSAWTALDGSLLKPETMAGWLGGGSENSAWFRAIVKPLQDAKAREVDLLNKTVRPVTEAFEHMPKSVRASLNDKIDGAKLFPGHAVKSGQNIAPPSRRFELLMMALNMGNESNAKRLTEGRGISENQVLKAIDDTLTKEEMDWVQSVWSASDSMWHEASALEERDSGIAPEKIPARPLVTKFGTYPGGYFPAIYDRRVEHAGERQVANAVAALMDPSFTRGDTARSHLKGRVDNFAGALSLEPSSIPRHLAQVAHDIAFREAVKSVGGLLLDPEMQATMKDRLGDGRAKHFVQWVKDVGQMRGVEGFTHSGMLLRMTRQIRANTVIAALGYAVPNMIEDTSNLVAAIPRTDLRTKHLAAAVAEFMTSPRDVSAMAHEKSGELRTRREQFQRELQHQVGGMVKSGPFARGPLEAVRHHAFALMEMSDHATSTPIWVGAYRQTLADTGNEQAAITHADAVVRKVFPSHSAVDLAGILRDKGFVGTSLTFYGFLSTYYNGLRDIGHAFSRKSLGEQARVGGRLIGYMVAVAALSELLRGRGREPDEDWGQWFLRKMLASGLTSVPYGGDVANYFEGQMLGKKTNPRVTSLVSTASQVAGALMDLGSDKDIDRKVAGLVQSLGPVVGLPAAQPVRTGRYLYDVSTRARQPADPLEFLSGVIYGEKDSQPATPFRGAGQR